LFGFTLSYDEFARTLLTAGSDNTLPLEIFGMTTNVTTPVLYALGTVTTALSFLAIGVSLLTMAVLRRAATTRPSGSVPPAVQTGIPAQIPPMPQ
jgi:putative spermidine/putrescine transport system permease protein